MYRVGGWLRERLRKTKKQGLHLIQAAVTEMTAIPQIDALAPDDSPLLFHQDSIFL
jgi:hypothetical protein